ncbi:hypothetical protein HDF08_001887 [Edaphobacter lichenicola]|uniref:Uncharacterized protein n=1 Tax=Tunturiibacter lichenicola TaxID=2051959 RepID=A0A852VDQ4_9BACT|nr:hypothetical protein [Edaphobacter lichenicola]
MVRRVGEVEVAGGVGGEAVRECEGCGRRGSGVAGEAGQASAGDGGDQAGAGGDLADAVVVGVGKVEIAGGVDGNARGRVDGSGEDGGPVAGVALRACAGDGGDETSAGIDAADAVVRGVGEIEVAGGVDGESGGEVELGGEGGGAVS